VPPRVVIVGMGGVFPGARTLDELWALIAEGRSAARPVPRSRWMHDPDALVTPHAVPDRVVSTTACLVDEIPWHPGALDPARVEPLDASVRMALAAGHAAWGRAPLPDVDAARVGVALGQIALPTDGAAGFARAVLGGSLGAGAGAGPAAPAVPLDRYVAGLPAGLLAQAWGLGAGAVAIDAACASSLYAIHHALEALRAGSADAMLAGGLSRPSCLYTQIGFSQLRALSPRGRCAPFDRGADGLVVGEGCGLFVLERLDDALDKGHPILAEITGLGLSNDIGGSLLAPSSPGQLRALRAAYEQAGWSPLDVELIECHGTGAPLGDATELSSLATLHDLPGPRPRRTVVGSVKSNVGHLLTAAGAAGLTKVLLAMREGTLPPTAHLAEPLPALADPRAPFEALASPRPWPRRDGEAARRAAVSAFGFGGVNAHLLVEEWRPDAAAARPRSGPRRGARAAPGPGGRRTRARAADDAPLAVVGLHARVGELASTPAWERALFGEPHPGAAGPAPFGTLEVPLRRFAIPPIEIERMLPQQLAMLTTMAAALDDAGPTHAPPARHGTESDEEPFVRTGVYVGLALDLNTTNFHLRWALGERAGLPALDADRTMGALGSVVASRVARAVRAGGPSFALAGEEGSGLVALARAAADLRAGTVDRALVGAVDLPTDPRAEAGHGALHAGDAAPADAAVGLVLRRLEDAERDGDRIHAVVRGLGAATGAWRDDTPRPGEATWSSARTGARAGLVDRPGDAWLVCEGPAGWAPEARPPGAREVVAADLEARLGRTGAATGLVLLAGAAACLRHRLLPGGRPWLVDGTPRALVGAGSTAGACVHAVLEAAPGPPRRTLSLAPEALFVVEDAALDDGLAALDRLAAGVDPGVPVEPLARRHHAGRHRAPEAPRAVALVARTAGELRALVARARARLDRAGGVDEPRLQVTPPDGAPRGEVAFVFPGSGTQEPGMGRELLRHLPALFGARARTAGALTRQLMPDAIWGDDAGALAADAHACLFGLVTLGTLCTDALAACGVRPDAALGYSLGETSALFALGVWRDRDGMLARLEASPLFRRELAGPCDAVRRAWSVPDGEPAGWRAAVVERPAARVRAAIRPGERVRVLIVNTPGACVVGGLPDALEALLARLDARAHRLDGVTAVHAEVVEPVARAYRELHVLPTHPTDARVYRTHDARPYRPTSDSAADAVLAQARAGFDFPALVRRAWDDGVRVFLEMGPGSSCTRMIEATLADVSGADGPRPFARAVCARAPGEWTSLLRALAVLAAARRPVDLSALYGDGAPPDETTDGPRLTVRVGAELAAARRDDAPPPPAEAARTADARPAAPGSDAPPRPTPDAPRGWTEATASAHGAFLAWHRALLDEVAGLARAQASRLGAGPGPGARAVRPAGPAHGGNGAAPAVPARGPGGNGRTAPAREPPDEPVLDRPTCLAFARGAIGDVLGPAFAAIDAHPTRVRLPDEPLMLVDRVLSIDAEPLSMRGGSLVTEHDVGARPWYLDGGCIPTCLAVEAGQADLLLSAYLGVDLHTRGLACYRLLDAAVTFHDALPARGRTIRYEVTIDGFFRQADTILFRFRFDASVDGRPLLTMRDGCAGFFTRAQLEAGEGLVAGRLEPRAGSDARAPDGSPLAPLEGAGRLDAARLDALRAGDLATAFGDAFADLPVARAATLPGGRMALLDRVVALEPRGGARGLGRIAAEADVDPEAWYLACHFVDDRVMPGTLMYEGCLHALRILLLRLGWVGEEGEVVAEPVPGVTSRLKCRGQVVPGTRTVTYEVDVVRLGHGTPDDAEPPFAIVDALMRADGRPIVEIRDMSVRLRGLRRTRLEALWDRGARGGGGEPVPASPAPAGRAAAPAPTATGPARTPAIVGNDAILAFAIGRPSDAFGERYRVFDHERTIARLPGPPYKFLDRITRLDAEPFALVAGGSAEAQYDVPPDAWYFAHNRQPTMPFCVLLEVALQPCGWLAAHAGSALASDEDTCFRNLGGRARLHRAVPADVGTLATEVTMTKVSRSGGMIIQDFRFAIRDARGPLYEGTTNFGFFGRAALARQVGLRDVAIPDAGAPPGSARPLPDGAPFPAPMLRMVETLDGLDPRGGPAGLGRARGRTRVDPRAWFFAAHFHQDPVWPGSLGLESLLQVLGALAQQRWDLSPRARWRAVAPGTAHAWEYRGQVLPDASQVVVDAWVTALDEDARRLTADGVLSVDGRPIYRMRDFTLEVTAP